MYYATKYINGRLKTVPHRTAWGRLVEVSGLYRKRPITDAYAIGVLEGFSPAKPVASRSASY